MMISNRKMQALALIVIANGVGALSLTTSLPAQASTCNPTSACIPCQGLTQAQLDALCAQHTPPGCTVSGATCLVGPASRCNPESTLLCNYT